MLTYESLIRDKRVAIVGPAQYMMGKKLGKEIDSHDIVVRINRSIESCENFGNDIGFRTDVLYSCMIEKPENAGKMDITNMVNKNIKFICIPPRSTMKGIAFDPKAITASANLKKLDKIKSKINTRVIDMNLNNAIAKNVDCRPNTGYLAIFDLLSYNPKVLSIYGFSFYLDGFIENSKSGITNMTEKEYAEKCFNSKRHVQKNLWKYAKDTLLINQNVKLDKTLELILKMKTFTKNEFKNSINLK